MKAICPSCEPGTGTEDSILKSLSLTAPLLNRPQQRLATTTRLVAPRCAQCRSADLNARQPSRCRRVAAEPVALSFLVQAATL